MKVLLNFDANQKNYLPNISFLLKNKGFEPAGISKTLTADTLVDIAATAGCQCILICHEETLRNILNNPKATLDNYRGSRLNLPIPTVVINSLHQFHTVPYGSFIMEKDVNKLLHVVPLPPKTNFTVLQNQSIYPEVLDLMSQSILTAYDIETKTFLEDEKAMRAGETLITCAGWSILLPNGEVYTFVLPLIDFNTDHWVSDKKYIKAIEFLQQANALPTPKVMHNGIYDCTHSLVYHAPVNNYCLDTMALHHAEYAELPKSLDFVASIHLPDYHQWKDEAEAASKTKNITAYWAYNAADTYNTLKLCMAQLRNMPAYAKDNFADKFKLVYPSLYCAFEGFNIDQSEQTKLRVQGEQALATHRTLLQTYFADPAFNPGSWQQVEKYIYKVFGATKPKVGKSKSGTDEKNLKEVAEQHPLLARLVESILEYRGAQKAVSTYLSFLQKKGRLLWNLNPFGTESERMSCNASSFWCGAQVQNIPKYAKSQLTADEGFELAELDNKQSEGRCTAYLAQDTALIKALEDPVYDFYKTLGTLFFNIPYEQVSDFFRNKVLKKIVHGTNYMMGGKTFKENIGAKILHETSSILGFKLVASPSKRRPNETTIIQFAQYLLEKYHVPFPKVRLWYATIKAEVQTTGMLKSPLGHTRRFFGNILKDHNVLRSAVAHQPQNLSVHILNIGLWKIYKKLVVQPTAPIKLGDFRLKAQIHDSVLAQYRIELRDIIIPYMLKLMDNPVMVYGRELRIPVDAKLGATWNKMTDYVLHSDDKNKGN